MSNRMWMVRAGDRARLIDIFKEKNIVAVGFSELGQDTIKKLSREEYQASVIGDVVQMYK